MKNYFLIDYLTINIKNVVPTEMISLFCNVVRNNDVKIDNFIHFETGAIAGYNNSYRFLGEKFITFSYHTDFPQYGLTINISGQGCNFLKSSDFVDYISFLKSNEYDYNVTRCDIAYDDFNKIIPINQMIESLKNYMHTGKNVSTKILRSSVTIYDGTFNGIYYTNFKFGSRYSTGGLRLYDKRAEQKCKDLDYWYRLELELRKEKAHAFMNLYLTHYNNFADLYVTILNSILRFIDDSEDYHNKARSKNSGWYTDFLAKLGNTSLKSTFKNQLKNLKDCKKKYFDNLDDYFYSKVNHLTKQYGAFLSLLQHVNPERLKNICYGNTDTMLSKSKYQVIFEHFKNKYDLTLYNFIDDIEGCDLFAY